MPLLPVLCALSLAGDHAELHPASTNVYLEVPDLQAVVAAYESAPFAKLFRDEKVRRLIANLSDMEPESVSFHGLVGSGLTKLRDELPVIGAQAIDLLPDVRRVSLSVSGIRLEGLTKELLAAEGDWSPQLEARAGNVRVRAILDFDSAQTASRAGELLRSQVEQESEADFTRENVSASFAGADLSWTYIRSKDTSAPIAFWFATQEARLILGAGWSTPSDKLFPVAQSLAASEAFASCAKHIPGGDGVPVVNGYTSLEGLHELPQLAMLVPELPPTLGNLLALGLEACHPAGKMQVRSHARLNGSRFVTESFERDFGPAMAPRLHGAEAIAHESFRMVPEDAVGVWATQLDKEGLRAYLMQSLAEMTGEDPEDILTSLEDEYGFRPDRDLVDSLGGQFVFYTLPLTGIGMPKLYVAVELEDSEAFARGLEGLGAYLTEVGQGAVKFSSKPYRKSPFFSFAPEQELGEMIAEMDSSGMLSWAPAFLSVSAAVGVLEDRAIVSLSSMYTKREMKRLMGDEATGPYLALAEAREFPKGIREFGRTDWGSILGGIYESVLGFFPLIEQGLGEKLPFDIDDLPASSIFDECFQPTISWSRAVEGGAYEFKESSFGPEVWLGFGVLIVGATGSLRLSDSTTGGELPPPRATTSEGDVESGEDPVDLTTSRLKELKIAIVVYKGDTGAYPASLTNLLEATTNYPNGFLGGSELPVDAWERAFRYTTDPESASYELWSLGPDGIDQEGAGDDVTLIRRQH